MLDAAAVYSELSTIFADIFERDVPLSAGLTAKDVVGWDSFKQIEIIIAAEQRFALKFTSSEVDSMRALGDLVDIVERRGRLDAKP